MGHQRKNVGSAVPCTRKGISTGRTSRDGADPSAVGNADFRAETDFFRLRYGGRLLQCLVCPSGENKAAGTAFRLLSIRGCRKNNCPTAGCKIHLGAVSLDFRYHLPIILQKANDNGRFLSDGFLSVSDNYLCNTTSHLGCGLDWADWTFSSA